MSRNSSGVYSLPSGNPVVTDTVIESAWANNTMEDIGDTLSDSLDRTGKGGMLAPLLLADGTVSLPAYAFVSDETSGIYKADTADYRFSIQGSDLLRYRPGVMSIKSVIGDATAGPDFVVHRNSPTPAAADLLGRVKLDGENSADEQVTYAQISASLVDPTDASEDGSLTFWTMQDGTLTEVMFLDEGGDVSITNGGSLTVDGDTTVGGNTTVDGNLTVTGDTVLGDTVTVGGEPLSSFVGAIPSPTKHRYWRITIDEVQGGAGNGELRLNELHFFAGGLAYVNGQRWEPGTDVTSSIVTLGGSGAVGGGSRAALINGIDDAFGASFPNAVLNGYTIIADFGGNPQRLTSIQQVAFLTDEDWLSGFTMAYSDDNSTWTDVGTFTELPAPTADIPSDHYTLTEQVQTYEPDELKTYPEVTSGGGGGGSMWTFDPTIRTSDLFFPSTGTYYLLDASGGSFNVVLDSSSYSEGDYIGFSLVNGTGNVSLIRDDGATVTFYGETTADIGDANALVRHVSLVYDESADNWNVFAGGLQLPG